MLSDQTERRVVAFVRSVANDCCSCNRRSDYNCDHCHSLWANSLMREIELDVGGKTKEIDYSLAARIGKIMLALKTNGRPMMSREINLEGTCSFQLKLWTLKHMVKKGIIGRRVARRSNNKNYYFYFLKPNRETKNENRTHRDR